ncbi:ATP-binding protein [Clostridium gasigenes]|uniref:ATP-binding protein n=1 Tax=Clostridium gasigenes TaxID=94869 RepID=UPI001C0C56D5|nr:sensor histidine kinase [Clostridium gasigenes]MBU3102628.1 sensor histidine kinase [Clostridium gasigenes]MBU3106352.1 sensor histidine kinase [Clostridium gasigenes]
MSLEKKITKLVVGIFIAVVLVISVFSLAVINSNLTTALSKRLTDTAFVIAANPIIQEELSKGTDPTYLKVQNFVERMRLKIDLLFISVIDMNSVRYSHPIPDNIGRKFLGGDEKRVISTGEVYVTESHGHLGNSIRAFAPVYKDGVQVGAVAVGILKRDLREEVRAYFFELIPVFLISLLIIIFLAKKLAKNIKNDIYGLEPEDIAIQLREKESIINNMEEGLIAVNNLGQVTVINKKALNMLRIKDERDIDEKIISLLNKAIYRRSRIFNKEIRLSEDIIIMANFYSIVGEYGTVVGAIASLQDFTKVRNMAEELTGVKELTWNLRAQNHEFMNKLHTISGLIQLEENDKAIEYIFATTEKRGLITDNLSKIKDPSIQGLLFSKYNRADEMKIKFEIDEKSYLNNINNNVKVQELLTVIGNIIENSIEELRVQNDGWIYCGIFEEEKIKIVVKNNGRKIDEDTKKKIFERGYSTKGEGRGFGLYNIKTIVNNLGGELRLTSDEITVWEIIV